MRRGDLPSDPADKITRSLGMHFTVTQNKEEKEENRAYEGHDSGCVVVTNRHHFFG